jgi:hypothetical protein
MAEIKMPHPDHEQHLCLLMNLDYICTNKDDYKNLVRNPNYVCLNCGRTAASDKSLCAPERL